MAGTRYRKGHAHSADMAAYMRKLSEENTNSEEISRLKRNLIRAIQEEVSERQRQALLLYYVEGLNQREIGERCGVDKSTISRTIKRGEKRLQRCLRYGAARLLDDI